MEPDDVSQIARFLRGQNLVNNDCGLVLYSVLDRQPVRVGKFRSCVVRTSGPCYDSRGGVLDALNLVQIRSRRAVRD